MKARLTILTIISLVCLAFGVNNSYAAPTPAGFADLVEKLTPCVVNISTTQKLKGGATNKMQKYVGPNGEEMPGEFSDFIENPITMDSTQSEHKAYSLGSGFIIDKSGYIATNNHVIANADEISVILSDDTKLKAKIVGRDIKTDLALLKVDAGRNLPSATLGDSGKARVGDWVIAIGNPFGFGGTVTAGIISARARNINVGPFDDFIQTDAAINSGNSGGPMFNMKGEVIGINTVIFSPSGENVGIGFAMPVAMAKTVFSQLKATGHVERGWLGIKIQNVTREIADNAGLKKIYGAHVMDVAKDGPSYKAGIITGDIITRFDGREIKEMRNLPFMVAETGIGKDIALELWRKGAFRSVNVRVGELKDSDGK